MEFYLVDVKSIVNVNGVDVAFDYINTYYNLNEAIKEAKLLFINKNVTDISVHKWILGEDGSQRHSDDIDSVPFHIRNVSYSEWKY